ncbi:MAG: hypothetical protein JNM39_07575 [Bdellovibrionaceae bacterium]|nr:hypothetical protein [Pseudobdellovibrionaceae bacterium]
MARTHKDKRDIYRHENEITPKGRPEPGLKRRFLNFKKSGAPIDGDQCPECGGLTDFHNGYLTCSECGWTEDVLEMFEMERFSA